MEILRDSPNYTVNSLDRGLAALNHFISQPEMSFTAFLKASKLNKAAAKRTLYTLEKNGFIRYNPNRNTYFLGIKMFELGTVASENFALLKVSRPYIESICNQINETVIVSQKVDNEQVYLYKIEGAGTVHLQTLIGHRRPMYYGLGKTILAYLCDDELESYLPKVVPTYSMHTITDRAKFIEDIQQIRARGYAVDEEEFVEGVVGIGFPVFLNNSDIYGLVGVVAPTSRMTCEKRNLVVDLLSKASSMISSKLHDYIYDIKNQF